MDEDSDAPDAVQIVITLDGLSFKIALMNEKITIESHTGIPFNDLLADLEDEFLHRLRAPINAL